jgi:biopolymer transport protein ExbD
MAHARSLGEGSEVLLPIPSFLDMAFQILAFFIFTYNPASMEGQIEMAMPASGEARAPDQEQADPTKVPDTELELTSELTVTLTTGGEAATGAISSIAVEGADLVSKAVYSTAKAIEDDLERGMPTFQNFLKGKQAGLTNKDSIKIRADSALKYVFVVKVMDACSKAGFKHIGFAPPPDYSGAK